MAAIGLLGLWVCSWLFFLQRKRERETGKERDGRKGKKKINNKEIIFKLRGKKNRITDIGCFVK